MVRLIKDYPAEGWVRSKSAIDETSVKEIARLQNENNELKKKISLIATEAPKGSEDLSQGDEEVVVYVKFNADPKDNKYETFSCNASINITWNEIFTMVSPCMINECTDIRFENSLNELVSSYSDLICKQSHFKDLVNFRNFKIDSESFNLVKVQFRALGLICLSDKKRTASDRNTYWKLTPHGDYVMTKLLAIKRQI